jgi:glycine cleavage system regulatory protein
MVTFAQKVVPMAKSSVQPGGGGHDPATPSPPPASAGQGSGAGSQALLLVSGADHPGILDDISHYVTEREARIEAVRVVNLSGRFALLMQVSGEESRIRAVEAELDGLMERTGIRVTVEPVNDRGGVPVAGTSFSLMAVGRMDADESTTLRQTSNLLRVMNINIRDVETKRTPAGGFDMRMKIDVPRDVPVGQLRELLGQLLSRQPLEWDLSAAPAE